MSDVILRIRQQGFVRTGGYQVTQWAVTVPVSDPISDPPIATSPLSYAPLFLMRNEDFGFESFEGIASLQDFVSLEDNELEYFEIKGQYGNTALINTQIGDTLNLPSTSLDYWLLDSAPYLNNQFTISGLAQKASGVTPLILTGNKLVLTGYTFTDDDIGRWFKLAGFTTSSYNTYVQVISYTGNVATINITTTTNEAGSVWEVKRFQVVSNVSPSLEPRYFSEAKNNLAWEIKHGGSTVASNTVGLNTQRRLSTVRNRAVRMTYLAPTLDTAMDFMAATRDGVKVLQAQAAKNNTTFSTLITTTFGP